MAILHRVIFFLHRTGTDWHGLYTRCCARDVCVVRGFYSPSNGHGLTQTLNLDALVRERL